MRPLKKTEYKLSFIGARLVTCINRKKKIIFINHKHGKYEERLRMFWANRNSQSNYRVIRKEHGMKGMVTP